MKKTVSILLVLSAVFSLFAGQITFSSDSYEAVTLRSILDASSVQTVQMTYPISADQMLLILTEVDEAKLPSALVPMYENLKARLEDPLVGSIDFKNGVKADPALVLGDRMHTRTSGGGGEITHSDLLFDIKDGSKIAFVFETELTDKAAGHFEIGIESGFSDKTVSSMIFFEHSSTDGATPFEAWGSVGSGALNLTVGRDRLQAGAGKTGDVNMGDNFTFQNFAKASVVTPKLSYDITVRTFDNETVDENGKPVLFFSPLKGKVASVVDHRFSAAFKHLTFTGIEGMLVYSDSALSDPRFYNPFMFLHNFFSFYGGETNNYMGFEVGLKLPYGLQVNGQIMIDQFVLASEKAEEENGSLNAPTSIAALMNFSRSRAVSKGVLSYWAEFVYSSPFVFQRCDADEQYVDTDGYYNFEGKYYETDLYVGYKRSGMDEMAPLGYRYGADCVVVALGSDYHSMKTDLSASMLYRIHGQRNSYDKLVKPETVDENGYRVWDNKAPSGEVLEHTFRAKLSASYRINDSVSLDASAGALLCQNRGNIEGKTLTDFQFTLGASATFDGHLIETIKGLF